MAKSDFGVVVAFATQAAEGDYNDGLDAITDTIDVSDGLVLGDADAGIRESGLTLGFGRKKKDKAFIGTSFTRSLSDFLKAEVRTFSFAMPFCGNRVAVDGAPADGDAIPIVGLDALLEGMGLVGTAWGGADVGHRYVFASPNPISSLIYYFDNRVELMDCRVSGSILFVPEDRAILTATIEVGSIKDHTLVANPAGGNLTYGEQQSVSAPVIKDVGFLWRTDDDPRVGGFTTLTLNIAPSFADIPDSNAAEGVVKEAEDRVVSIEGSIFEEPDTDAGHVYEQLTAEDIATLDPIDFLVGDVMEDTFPAKAVGIIMPDPEPDEATINALGSKAGHDVTLIGRGAAENEELEIIFQ